MIVLGFDASLARTGWAALDYDTGQLVDCGVIATWCRHIGGRERIPDLYRRLAAEMEADL
jgi:hypothetical protein